MIIHALKQDTGLTRNYRLETVSTPTGCIVTVYIGRQCIGQFTNNRQDTSDHRPLDNIVEYTSDMGEVIEYFSK